MKYAIEMSVILMVFMVGSLLLMDFLVALDMLDRMHHDRDFLVRRLEVADGDIDELKKSYDVNKTCRNCNYLVMAEAHNWKISVHGKIHIKLLQLELPFETYGIAYKS